MTYKKLKTDLQRELLLSLILGMKRKSLSSERARVISRAFLAVSNSSKDEKDLINKVSRLCQDYPELVDGYLKTARKYEDEEVTKRLAEIKVYLNADIDLQDQKGGNN